MQGTFTDWLAQLDELARDTLGREIVPITGHDCWRELYEDGLTPAEALEEDRSHAEAR